MLVCGHPEVEAVHRLQFSNDSASSSSQSHPSSWTCLAPRSPLQALVYSPSAGLVSDSSLNQSPLPGCYFPKSSHNCIKSKSHRKALIPKYNGSASLSETGLMQYTKPKGVRPYSVLSLPRMFILLRVTALTFWPPADHCSNGSGITDTEQELFPFPVLGSSSLTVCSFPLYHLILFILFICYMPFHKGFYVGSTRQSRRSLDRKIIISLFLLPSNWI